MQTAALQTKVGLLLKSAILERDWLVHGFGSKGVEISSYLRVLGVKHYLIAQTRQLHSDTIIHLTKSKIEADTTLDGDSFVTSEVGIVCFVRTADCVPVLLADIKNRVVAAVHSGWRGTALDICGKTLAEMKRIFGTCTKDIKAAIGPYISGKNYKVGKDVADILKPLFLKDAWLDEMHFDNGRASAELLIRAGVPSQNIDIFKTDTFSDLRFASYRRDKATTIRQISFIMITAKK